MKLLPFLLLSVAVTATTACSPHKGSDAPGAQSPERQSDAEVDLATDLMRKGQPRAALDHAQKAIALNEDNEKAQYIAAGIYLSFCSDQPRARCAPIATWPRPRSSSGPP